MKRFVILIISVSTLLIVISGCEFFYNYLLSKTYLGDVKVTMTVENLSQELTFNQSIPDIEYAWRVFIDTDANLLTGDGSGFEVRIQLEVNYYYSNTATLASVLDDESYTLGEPLGTISSWTGSAWEIKDEREVFLDGNTLYLGVDSSNSLFTNLDLNYRTRFSTEHFTGVATVTDVIDADLTGNGTGTDPVGDSIYPFINITGVVIEFP